MLSLFCQTCEAMDVLLRTWKDGRAKFNAYLEDYAFLSEGLLTLFETTGELRWLEEALALTDRMIEEFWDDESGGFFFTGKSHESLIVRSKDYFDNATPSGNSVAGNRPAATRDTHRYATTIGTSRPQCCVKSAIRSAAIHPGSVMPFQR